jgi:hypothetical protein
MHPKDVPISNGLFKLRVVATKAFSKTGQPVAAAAHPHKVVRRGHDEANRE